MGSKVTYKKVFNDPIYGFVTIPFPIVETLIEHPYFQRLRRIQQLGLTNLVFPGALHTRFQHAIGAMHLMGEAIDILRSKGVNITDDESIAVTIAILLHDIGHGPFSHTLENTLVKGINHESLTEIFIDQLNKELHGKLDMAMKIFRNTYPKKFLHQLVSSQLDMDRLDYLRRDSFYTGVQEGITNTSRIIKMLNVYKDSLTIDSKGIYSIEKFIIARRLMYWQVYLHKTVVSTEYLLINILKRARFLSRKNVKLFSSRPLEQFISNNYTLENFKSDPNILRSFSALDDYDILSSIKEWVKHKDFILSYLSKSLINRKLFKIRVQNKPFSKKIILQTQKKAQKLHEITDSEIGYFVVSGKLENSAYNPMDEKIEIMYSGNKVIDLAKASDHLNISALSSTVKKYFLCCPEDCLDKGLLKGK